MAKDSQPDNKQARMEKCNYQTPITEEGHNHNPNAKHKSIKRQGVSYIMAKDSQPDNKQARMEKCNYQTPITEEGHNHNPNAKHKSIKRQGVSSEHYNPAGN